MVVKAGAATSGAAAERGRTISSASDERLETPPAGTGRQNREIPPRTTIPLLNVPQFMGTACTRKTATLFLKKQAIGLQELLKTAATNRRPWVTCTYNAIPRPPVGTVVSQPDGYGAPQHQKYSTYGSVSGVVSEGG